MPFKHITETHVNLIESGLISSKTLVLVCHIS